MAVKYILKEMGTPGDPTQPKKFYAQEKSSGEVTFRNLGKEIAAASTTVSDTDVMAVLNDLTKILQRHLAEGRIVRFGDFGSFRITISSDGAETEEKFNASFYYKRQGFFSSRHRPARNAGYFEVREGKIELFYYKYWYLPYATCSRIVSRRLNKKRKRL